MQYRPWPVLVYLLLVGIGIGATVYFNVKGNVKVVEGNITISPSSFSVNLTKGVEYVKQVVVRNYGAETCVYFEDVVEGPSPKAIDVSYRDEQGRSIYSAKKLCLLSGTAENPSNTTVNVHLEVKDDAKLGDYSVYIFVRS